MQSEPDPVSKDEVNVNMILLVLRALLTAIVTVLLGGLPSLGLAMGGGDLSPPLAEASIPAAEAPTSGGRSEYATFDLGVGDSLRRGLLSPNCDGPLIR